MLYLCRWIIKYKYNSLINRLDPSTNQKYIDLLKTRENQEIILIDKGGVDFHELYHNTKTEFDANINFIGEFKKLPENPKLLDLWKLHVDCYEQFIRINPDYVSRNSRNSRSGSESEIENNNDNNDKKKRLICFIYYLMNYLGKKILIF